MATQSAQSFDSRTRIAWIVMVVLAAGSTVNSFVRVFWESAPEPVVGWVGFSLLATVILLIPFLRGERWAWYSTWILALGFASVAVVTAGPRFGRVGIGYLGGGAIVALCLLVTRRMFFHE
jgi:hypothetical protein